MIRVIIFLFLGFQAGFAQGQLTDVAAFCDSMVMAGINRKEVPGLGLVIIRGDSTYASAWGYAKVEKKISFDSTTLFQLGSVGKLFTVIAVLQQVEKGNLDLHEDVNHYLKGFVTNPPGRPITLFDLLTHTGGLDDHYIGYLSRKQSQVKSLGEHLKEHLPPSFQPPGTEINYSNYGFALAGHIVEQVTEMKFTEYVAQNIFAPLGMSKTTYFLPDNYQDLANYACGYRIRETYENVISYPRHATPAGSALSCVSDMKKLLREFLHPSGKVLKDTGMAMLFSRQFTNHPLLMGYTLGMEEQHINGYRGLGKGGSFTGFISEFIIFPDQQVGLFITTNTQTDNFLEAFSNELLKKVLPPIQTPAKQPIRIEVQGFVGTYRSERSSHRTVEDLLSLYQGKFDLDATEEGDLVAFHNGSLQHYQAIDSLIFQNKTKNEEYLVFEREASGKISRLYRNVNLAGFYVPISLSPIAWYDDPVFINDYYFLILVIMMTFLFIPVFRGWVWIRRRRRPSYWQRGLVPVTYLYPAISIVVLYTVQLLGGLLFLARNVTEFYFGVPDMFRWVQLTTFSYPLLLIWLSFTATMLWKNSDGKIAFRIYFSVITFCALIHFAFLYRWHFIGVNV